MPTAVRPGRLTAASAAAGLVTALGGCASPLPVAPAPYAADPVCASVVLALPDELDGMAGLRTGAQATAAWGERSAPVVLRCGVEPPPPSTDPCVTVDDGTTAVDWLAVEEDPGAAASAWTFTTYGRVPAVEVHVPAEVTAVRSTSFLVELGPAVARVAATRACL